MFKQNCVLLVVLVCLFSAVGTVFGANSSNQADLDVEFLGNNSPWVNTTYTYRVRVNNIGGAKARNVKVAIDLPLTNTSPQVYVLGTVSGLNNRCQLVSNKLECDLGNIKPGKRKNARFDFEFPYANMPLDFTATATTTSNDTNQANNLATKSPNVRYPQSLINGGDVTLSFCVGQNLVAYFSCTQVPSSTQSISANFASNGTATFPNNLNVTGSWYQASPNELNLTTTDGTNTLSVFNGYAVSANCFEGINTYPNSTSGYIAPTRICLQ